MIECVVCVCVRIGSVSEVSQRVLGAVLASNLLSTGGAQPSGAHASPGPPDCPMAHIWPASLQPHFGQKRVEARPASGTVKAYSSPAPSLTSGVRRGTATAVPASQISSFWQPLTKRSRSRPLLRSSSPPGADRRTATLPRRPQESATAPASASTEGRRCNGEAGSSCVYGVSSVCIVGVSSVCLQGSRM